ncbi:MAG: ABC transporter substrate-binding protein [Bacteroidota bacterium]
MKKYNLIAAFICLTAFCNSQTDTLFVNYYSQAPFAVNDSGTIKGVEIDIINEYSLWLKIKKNITLPVKYNMYTDFDQFYAKTKSSSKNTIGLGSVSINAERSKEIDFTPAYLKNVSFCITNGHAPEIKTKTADEITRVLGNMTALTLTNTTLNKYVNDIKKSYIKDLKITNRASEIKILDEISKNVLYFGYVDAVGFWFYLKNNPQKFLKTQKIMNQSNEELAFIVPKGSVHKTLFNEFFSSATGGFKKSKAYRDILEKYLGPYMTQTMAVN